MHDENAHTMVLDPLDAPADGGRRDGGPELSVHVVRDAAELASLRAEWNAVARGSSATVYQTFEWLSLWWKHLGSSKNRSLHVVLFRDGDRLVGVAPFFLESTPFFGRRGYACLSLLGSGTAFNRSSGMFLDDGPSDYLDVIALPAYGRAVARAFCAHVRDNAKLIDEVELLNISPGSFVGAELYPAMLASGLTCTKTEADVCPHMTLSTPVAEYLKTLDSSVRRRFTQAQKAAEEQTLFTVRSAATPADVDESLAALTQLHQRRWRKLGYPGLFAGSPFSDFQRAVARAFFANGWLRMKRADSGHAIVAARLAFAYEGRLYDYLSGFDDVSPAAKRRPGIALLLSLMDDAVKEGVRSIDFLRGDEGYKFELTGEVRRNANILVVPREARAASRRLVMKLVRVRSYLRYVLAREWGLLSVQLEEHRFPASLYQYVRFRTERLVRKLKGQIRTPESGA